MSATSIAFVTFGCVFGAALVGLLLRRALPEHHLSEGSRSTVDRTIGIIVTLAALVLGLLVASAEQSYGAISGKLQQISADVVLLDHTMAQYGVETGDARHLLRRAVGSTIRERWPETAIPLPSPDGVKPWRALQQIQERLLALAPSNETQRVLQTRAVALSSEMARTSWLLVELTESRIPPAFLLILSFSWLVLIFFGFGIFAPLNGTVVAALLFSALAASGAIFLILEMYDPIGGWVKVPATSLLTALESIGP